MPGRAPRVDAVPPSDRSTTVRGQLLGSSPGRTRVRHAQLAQPGLAGVVTRGDEPATRTP